MSFKPSKTIESKLKVSLSEIFKKVDYLLFILLRTKMHTFMSSLYPGYLTIVILLWDLAVMINAWSIEALHDHVTQEHSLKYLIFLTLLQYFFEGTAVNT